MSTAEIVPVENTSLELLDPAARELAVTQYLTDARDRLAIALQATGPEAVAALKAEIATTAEATKQLGLSKEIRDDALEMVRRAEFALGKAIRAGQHRGEIATRIEQQSYAGRIARANQRGDTELIERKPSPSDFETAHALQGTGQTTGIYEMTDGVSDAQFDAALSDAKAEGNLSRANVVRKIKGVKQDGLTPVERLVKIRELAPSGRTSGQIAQELGLSEGYVRDRARENAIEITADKVLSRTHRVKVDHNHTVNHLVMTLEGLTEGLDRVDIDALDDTQMKYWVDSLKDSMKALTQFTRHIKEKTQ